MCYRCTIVLRNSVFTHFVKQRFSFSPFDTPRRLCSFDSKLSDFFVYSLLFNSGSKQSHLLLLSKEKKPRNTPQCRTTFLDSECRNILSVAWPFSNSAYLAVLFSILFVLLRLFEYKRPLLISFILVWQQEIIRWLNFIKVETNFNKEKTCSAKTALIITTIATLQIEPTKWITGDRQ
jgi:hypothetical protein